MLLQHTLLQGSRRTHTTISSEKKSDPAKGRLGQNRAQVEPVESSPIGWRKCQLYARESEILQATRTHPVACTVTFEPQQRAGHTKKAQFQKEAPATGTRKSTQQIENKMCWHL